MAAKETGTELEQHATHWLLFGSVITVRVHSFKAETNQLHLALETRVIF